MTYKARIAYRRLGEKSGRQLGEKEVQQKPERNGQIVFDHDGQTLIGRIAHLDPPDWEAKGIVPLVLVDETQGG